VDKLCWAQRFHTFEIDQLIVRLELVQSVLERVAEVRVCSERIDVHIPTHSHKLWSGQVVEGEVVFEQPRYSHDIVRRRRFSCRSDLYAAENCKLRRCASSPKDNKTNFSEKCLELLAVLDFFGTLDPALSDSLFEELGHLLPDFYEFPFLFLLITARRVRLFDMRRPRHISSGKANLFVLINES
jgi:hypothetical protein